MMQRPWMPTQQGRPASLHDMCFFIEPELFWQICVNNSKTYTPTNTDCVCMRTCVCACLCTLFQCFIFFKANDCSRSLSLVQMTHLGSDLSFTLITIITPTTSLQHAWGWYYEVTKNVHNTNKMTDIVNYVFRCTYATIDVYANTRC